MQAAENAEPRITFRDIHELDRAGGCELQFEIPAAPQHIPIARKGHYYVRTGAGLRPVLRLLPPFSRRAEAESAINRMRLIGLPSASWPLRKFPGS